MAESTKAGLARYKRLAEEAAHMAAEPDASGEELLRRAGAVYRDAYPTHERAAWPFLGAWVQSCATFAGMTPAARRLHAQPFAERTAWAVEHMPLLADCDGGAPQPPRHWWKDA